MLPLFPEPGLDQSVLTPVLLGVLVSWLFTETLGWTFVGLVVPGYLAAVFMIHPAAGCIEVLELVATYALARAFGETLPRYGLGFRIFGRERFLLVIVASLLVRVAVEAVALPALFGAAPWAYAMGFVVVPLAANACWKTGLARGLVQHGLPTFIVWVALHFVLMPFTNLSLGGFELMTQDVAGSFLASPKAYLVLLTTAFVASVANVRFGWDFGGVLVPSLLALGCFEPRRVVATIAMAGLVAAIGVGVGKLVDLEGPRKLVAFFCVEYVLRFVAGHALGRSVPGTALSELGGLGYLLPTLVALKLATRGALVVLPTAATTLIGFFSGSGLATGFALVDPALPVPPRGPMRAPAPHLELQATRDPFTGAPVAALSTTSAPLERTRPLARVAFALDSDAALDAPALPAPVPLPDRAALREHVTGPLLAGGSVDERVIATHARALGYRVSSGGGTIAIGGDDRALALLARPRRPGTRATIVACIQAQDRGLRDAAHRLAGAVDADMTLLLAADGGFDESMRTALELVRGGEPVQFLMVRGERPDAPGSTFGMLGDGEVVVTRAREGLGAFGVALLDIGPDRVARRITGGFDRDDVVVGFHFDPVAQAALSLTPLRKAQALLDANRRVAALDTVTPEALAALDVATTPGTRAVDILELLRMTARDESATAARALRRLTQSGEAQLAIVDAPHGPSFVLRAQTKDGLLVARAGQGTPGGSLVHVARGDDCFTHVREGGACLIDRR